MPVHVILSISLKVRPCCIVLVQYELSKLKLTGTSRSIPYQAYLATTLAGLSSYDLCFLQFSDEDDGDNDTLSKTKTITYPAVVKSVLHTDVTSEKALIEETPVVRVTLTLAVGDNT